MKILNVADIIPLKNGLIIKPFERDSITESGFELPQEQHQSTPVLGSVIAAGTESQFAVGDVVFFRRYSVDELSFNVDGVKQTVSFLTDNEVVATFKKNA